jgi:hypothetical protein
VRLMKKSPVRTGATPKPGFAPDQYDRSQYRPAIIPHRGDIGVAYPSKHASAFKSTKPGVGVGSTVTTDRKWDEIDRSPIRTWASARSDNYTGRGASEASAGPLRPRQAVTPPRYGDGLKPEKPGREPDQLKGAVRPSNPMWRMFHARKD